MNPGWCKKCGAEIYWVPRPDGGWFRPMERLKAQLPQEIQDFIDGRQALRVEDGVVEPFRFNTVLVIHECEKPAEVIESIRGALEKAEKEPRRKLSKKEKRKAKRALRERRLVEEADRIEAERIVAERQEQRRIAEQEQARKHYARRSARHGEFIKVDCPACGAPAGEPCHSMNAAVKPASPNYFNANPHQQRKDWAYGSGAIEEPFEEERSKWWHEQVRDPSVPRQRYLVAFLGETQDLWSEDWPIASTAE